MHTIVATVLLASLLAVALGAAVEPPTKEQQLVAHAGAQVAECSKEFGVPAVTVNNFSGSEATEAVQCFACCVSRKLKYVTENNQFDIERVIEFNSAFGLPEPVVRRKLETCKSVYSGAESCASVWEAFRCYEKA